MKNWMGRVRNFSLFVLSSFVIRNKQKIIIMALTIERRNKIRQLQRSKTFFIGESLSLFHDGASVWISFHDGWLQLNAKIGDLHSSILKFLPFFLEEGLQLILQTLVVSIFKLGLFCGPIIFPSWNHAILDFKGSCDRNFRPIIPAWISGQNFGLKIRPKLWAKTFSKPKFRLYNSIPDWKFRLNGTKVWFAEKISLKNWKPNFNQRMYEMTATHKSYVQTS